MDTVTVELVNRIDRGIEYPYLKVDPQRDKRRLLALVERKGELIAAEKRKAEKAEKKKAKLVAQELRAEEAKAELAKAEEAKAELAKKGPSVREPSQERPKQANNEHWEKVDMPHEGKG